MMTETLLLTVPEVAQALHICKSYAFRLVARGQLPSVTLGRARRVPRRALEAWLAKRDAVLARELSAKLVEGEGPDDEAEAPTGDGTLGIGSLRGRS